MAMDWGVIFIPKLLMTFIIIWVGFKVIHKLNELTNQVLSARKVDSTIKPFFALSSCGSGSYVKFASFTPGKHYYLKARRTAVNVRSMSFSEWAAERNAASNCAGGK